MIPLEDKAQMAAALAGEMAYRDWHQDRDRDRRPIQAIAQKAAVAGAAAAAPFIEAAALRDAADALGPGDAATALRTRAATIEQAANAECGDGWR